MGQLTIYLDDKTEAEMGQQPQRPANQKANAWRV